jgi:hypothetical protein
MNKSVGILVAVVGAMGAAGAAAAALYGGNTWFFATEPVFDPPRIDGERFRRVTPLKPGGGAATFAITGSSTNAGTAACNGPPASCPGGPPNVGAAWNTTVTRPAPLPTYTFGGWQDVLEVLYLGIVDTNLGHSTDPEVGGPHCNSAIRNAVANNWGAFFEAMCSGSPGDGNTFRCTSGAPCPCSQIQHIFRPDDSNGVADLFASVISGSVPNPSIILPNAAARPAPTTVGTYALGTDQFCNDVQNAGGTAWPGSAPVTVVPNDEQDYDPIRRPCSGGKGLALGTMSNPNGTEQVCERATANSSATATATISGGAVSSIAVSASGSGYTGAPDVVIYGGRGSGATAQAFIADGGVTTITVMNPGSGYTATPLVAVAQWQTQGTLGLLLPVLPTTTLTAPHTEDPNIDYQYNINKGSVFGDGGVNCGSGDGRANECSGQAIEVAWPTIPKPPGTGVGNNPGPCPNGDSSGPLGNACFVPADGNNNPNCIAYHARNAVPSFETCVHQVTGDGVTCSDAGPEPGSVDVRAYNLYSYKFNATTSAWSVNVDDEGRPILGGAFYRIHTSQDMLVPNQANAVTQAICNFQDPVAQIGCLVQASPCSLGMTAAFGTTDAGDAGDASFGTSAACLPSNVQVLLDDCPTAP